jgi:hypothetical protein
MLAKQYTLIDIENIIFNGIYYSLDESVLQIIKKLEKDLGVVEEIKRIDNVPKQIINNQNDKRRQPLNFHNAKKHDKKVKDVSNEDWNLFKTFKATQIESKEGSDKIIENIRVLINKISTKNYQQQFESIQREIHDFNVLIDGQDKEQEEKVKLVKMIFEIITSNKFFSDMYATLYIDLLPGFDHFNTLLKQYINQLKQSIENIVYINSDEDYDKYCDYVKQNDNRKAYTQFLINLCKKGAISVDQLLDILDYFINKTLEYVDLDNKTNEVEEITENVYIIISSSQSIIHKENLWTETILPKVILISQKKKNDHKSLSNRAIYKYMDIIDSIEIDI